MTENFPFIVSSVNVAFAVREIPFPKKLFSLTPNATVAPSVPAPAPNEISPVAFSSTVIFIILALSPSISLISPSAFLKKPKLFMLFNVLLYKISLNGSPSSI